jgi:quinol monooxygenase YgiN
VASKTALASAAATARDRALTGAARRQFGAVNQHDVDRFRRLGDVEDRVGEPVGAGDLRPVEGDLLRERPAGALDDVSFDAAPEPVPAVLGTGACLHVAYGPKMPEIIERGTPMSEVMIVVEFEVKPEHRSQFIDLMRGHAERSRRDDGCLQFDLMLPKDDDKHVFLVEKWRDQEALDAHAKGPMPGNTYKDWIVGRKVARGAPAD